jgi:hypothetical protein
MAATLDSQMLDDDFEEAKADSEATRWILERVGALEVTASMSPKTDPSEVFKARLAWLTYPGTWPSLKFLNDSGQDNDPRAWPVCNGFRPTTLDACVHWTRESQQIHPEWAGDARMRCPSTGNILLTCLYFLNDTLNHQYQGRFGT